MSVLTINHFREAYARVANLAVPRIIETVNAVEQYESIQDVRFKNRGMVVHKRVVMGRPTAYQIGNVMYVHPAWIQAVRDSWVKEVQKDMDRIAIIGSQP